MHACESWTLTAELQRRIRTVETRCFRKILRISYNDHVTNEEVRAKIQQAIGPHEDLTVVRDASWSGMDMSPVHQVCPKLSCKSQWKGEEDKADRRRGGKTTSGNGQVWSSPSRRGQWRTEINWRKLVVKSSVVPQRPPRLRDRWRVKVEYAGNLSLARFKTKSASVVLHLLHAAAAEFGTRKTCSCRQRNKIKEVAADTRIP